jgi:cyclase
MASGTIRIVVLTAMITCASAAVVVSGFQGRGQPQGPKIAKIEKVRDNLYLISEPTSGGNTSAFVTDNGVVLIDTKYAGWGQEILDKVKTVTDKPVTTIINSHTHGDHTGSNTFFPATVEFIAQENTRNNMAKETCTPIGNCQAFQGENAKYLPKKTFKDRMTIGSGKDRIEFYYFGRGHTSGDAIIVFPALHVAHFADLFARKAVPNVMIFDGGSAVSLPQTLRKAATEIKDVDTVITGHSTVMTWKDLQEFTDFQHEFLMAVQDGMKAGKKVDETAAEIARTFAAKYKDYTIADAKTKENVGLIYDELHLNGHYVK